MSAYDEPGADEGIAVVGMAGRFPGADNIATLWKNLLNGEESIRFFDRSELDPSLLQSETTSPDYVPARGVLSDADCFDAAFFGISAREAELMDPQNRVFLETAWHALESAGYYPESFDGLISVYAGMANNTYYATSVLPRPDLVSRLGEFQTMLANEKDFLATRVAHKLNLTGPAISLYTGCSTSLVAITNAFHSLMSFQSDMAIAGGVCITCPQQSGYVHKEDGIESIDGHCRPFSASASGTVFSNGVGIVVLKRLEDALADRDHIHAVIVGAALNNDGAAKVSFAAPSMQGQADVISMAQAQADIDPASIGYVEAHGTATQLGDPIEFEGLKKAFQYPQCGKQYCALGSVKSNFGHLLAAAGVTGFIKAALAVENGKIPPTLHFNKPNPNIDIDNSPFHINTTAIDWPQNDAPRRAAVSSFGIGGTNAHVVIEQAPLDKRETTTARSQLFLLSTRTEGGLNRARNNLAGHVLENEVNLADAAFTLQVGRRAFPYRMATVASSVSELREQLISEKPASPGIEKCAEEDPDIVFILPGHGTHYAKMGSGLYRYSAVYKKTVDHCAEILQQHTGFDIREILYAQDGNLETMQKPSIAQSAIFITEYALVKLLKSFGITPKTLIGHSLGEWVAATIAEVVSLEDALMSLAKRTVMFDQARSGAMLAVRLPIDELKAHLVESTFIAADNSPKLSVASGSVEAIAQMERALEAKHIPCKRLAANNPFHTPTMQEMVAGTLPITSAVRYSRPRIPIVSTITGGWINPQAITDPSYWARHHCEPVRFRAAVETAANNKPSVFLEVGPGRVLSTCVQQTLKNDVSVMSLLPDEWEGVDNEWNSLLLGLGKLWLKGSSINWHKLHDENVRRTALPTYPFEKNHYWLDAVHRADWMSNWHDS